MPLNFRIFGVPMDLGQRRRGVDMGPSAIRYAGLHAHLKALGHTVLDAGNFDVPLPEHEPPDTSRARHLPSIVGVCRDIYEQAKGCVERGERTIFLGGDHSLSIGTVSAITAHTQDVGVLWVDAHGDFNTPDITPSGNVHGMALAALMGLGPNELTDIGRPGAKLKPAQAVILGARDIDLHEKTLLRETNTLTLTMREVDSSGMAAAAQQALDHFRPFRRIHVSLDMDSIDPAEAPGVGTPVPGGLSYREAHLLMEILNDTGKVESMDIVEVNPILDDRNKTAKLAVELAASLFGKSIL
jgi:arginase